MDVGPLRDLFAVVLGAATGLLSGLFGVGGGVISQPGMRLIGLEPLVVIGTALPVIVPGAASGVVRYRREGLILWRAVAATVPVGLVGAVVGGVAAERVPGEGHLLQLVTASLLGLSAYRMGRHPPPVPPTEPLAETDAPDARDLPAPPAAPDAGAEPRPPAAQEAPAAAVHTGATETGAASTARYAGIGAVSGLLSGLLGIGGGVVMVPAFVQLARLEVKTAIATSLACVGLFALPGTITHALQDHVDWRMAIGLVVGVVPGARLGAALTIRATDRRIRVVVATFLGLTAVVYAVGELLSLR